MLRVTIGAALLMCAPLTTAHGMGLIERGCIATGGAQISRVCSCMQTAANMTLSRADQRTAQTFFLNPQAAQAKAVSARPQDKAFWGRYTRFLQAVDEACRD